MLKDIKNKIKKLGFISIELVILASVMLTAGGYGVAKLGSNMTGASKNQDGMFGEAMKELKGDIPEFVVNIRDGKVNTLYDVGENNLTDSDIIEINGIQCYVLEVDEENNRAKLITKDIYDVRFDTGDHTAEETTHLGTGGHANKTYDYYYSTLRTWMNEFYRTQLGADSRILPTTVTYYTKDSSDSNLDTYATGTIADQYVFALDAKEAKQYSSKFSWNYVNQMSGRGYGFWTTAGFRRGSNSIAWDVYYDGYFLNNGVDYSYVGARPAFWISLADKVE